ncbi:MAG: helix-turn-helix transcriptional regulator [Thermoplasmata archaeon]
MAGRRRVGTARSSQPRKVGAPPVGPHRRRSRSSRSPSARWPRSEDEATARPIPLARGQDRFVSLTRLSELSGVSRSTLRKWQKSARFPRPTYVTPDRREWFPRELSSLLRTAANHGEDLHLLFRREFLRLLHRLRQRDRRVYQLMRTAYASVGAREEGLVEGCWQEFLSGALGVYPRAPWIPSILRRFQLLREIERLTGHPQPKSRDWRRHLRLAVAHLEALEVPLVQWNRANLGNAITRNTPLTVVKRRYTALVGRELEPGHVLPSGGP